MMVAIKAKPWHSGEVLVQFLVSKGLAERESRAAACTNGLQQRHCKSVALLWPRCLSGADSEILARDMALKPHSDVMSCQGNQVKLLSARWGAHFVII